MKKRKILFLLIAVLCAALVFTACGDSELPPDNNNNNDTGDNNGGSTGNEGGNGSGDNQEEAPKTPELLDWFVIESNVEDVKALSKVDKIDGELVDSYTDWETGDCYYAIVKSDLDALNNVVYTISIFKNDELINKDQLAEDPFTGKYPLTDEYRTILNVELFDSFLVISVTKAPASSSSEESSVAYSAEYEFRTYADLARPAQTISFSDPIRDNVEMSIEECGTGYIAMTDYTVRFYDSNLGEIYEMSREVYDTYDDIDIFEATEDYIYFASYYGVQIFSGNKCVAAYETANYNEEIYRSFVLNDGNVLIQVQEELAFGAEGYNVVDNGVPYKVTTYTLSPDGKLTELKDVNFYVIELAPAFSSYRNFPFELKEGKQNQALISYFSLQGWSLDPQWVVLDNSLNVEYTVKVPVNTDFDNLSWGGAIDDERIVLPVLVGDRQQYQVFDLDLNPIAVSPNYLNYANDKYIITDSAVYNHDMKILLSFDTIKARFVQHVGDRVLVVLDQNYDGAPEFAFVDLETGKLDVISDNLTANTVDGGYSYYVVQEFCNDCLDNYKEYGDDYDEEAEDCYNCKHTLYNINGEAILSASGQMRVFPLDWNTGSRLIVSVRFEGKIVTYIVR